MIIKSEPISMPEALEYLKKENKELVAFIKKFSKLSSENAKMLREKLRGLDLIKANEKKISDIINLLPEDAEDLNKIFTDIRLDEDETKKIFDTVKEYI